MNGSEIAVLAAIVIAVVQAIKKMLPVQGFGAVVLTAAVTALVIAWHYLDKGLPFGVGAVALFVSVFMAANGGYQFLKKPRG
jgi:hypothetical protein